MFSRQVSGAAVTPVAIALPPTSVAIHRDLGARVHQYGVWRPSGLPLMERIEPVPDQAMVPPLSSTVSSGAKNAGGEQGGAGTDETAAQHDDRAVVGDCAGEGQGVADIHRDLLISGGSDSAHRNDWPRPPART